MKVFSRLNKCPKCGKQHGPMVENMPFGQALVICNTCSWGHKY